MLFTFNFLQVCLMLLSPLSFLKGTVVQFYTSYSSGLWMAWGIWPRLGTRSDSVLLHISVGAALLMRADRSETLTLLLRTLKLPEPAEHVQFIFSFPASAVSCHSIFIPKIFEEWEHICAYRFAYQQHIWRWTLPISNVFTHRGVAFTQLNIWEEAMHIQSYPLKLDM